MQDGAARTSDTVRELGFTFSSASEDAIIKGDKLSKVMQSLGASLANSQETICFQLFSLQRTSPRQTSPTVRP